MRQVARPVVLDEERAGRVDGLEDLRRGGPAPASRRAGWRRAAGSRRRARRSARTRRRAGRARTPSPSAGTGTTRRPGGARGGERAEVGRRLDEHGLAGRGERAERGRQRGLPAGADRRRRGRAGGRRPRGRTRRAAPRGPRPGRGPRRPAGGRRGLSAAPSAAERLQLGIEVAAGQRDRRPAAAAPAAGRGPPSHRRAVGERDLLPGEVGRRDGRSRGRRGAARRRCRGRGAARRAPRRPGAAIARWTVTGEARWRAISSRTDGRRLPGGRSRAAVRTSSITRCSVLSSVMSTESNATAPADDNASHPPLRHSRRRSLLGALGRPAASRSRSRRRGSPSPTSTRGSSPSAAPSSRRCSAARGPARGHAAPRPTAAQWRAPGRSSPSAWSSASRCCTSLALQQPHVRPRRGRHRVLPAATAVDGGAARRRAAVAARSGWPAAPGWSPSSPSRSTRGRRRRSRRRTSCLLGAVVLCGARLRRGRRARARARRRAHDLLGAASSRLPVDGRRRCARRTRATQAGADAWLGLRLRLGGLDVPRRSSPGTPAWPAAASRRSARSSSPSRCSTLGWSALLLGEDVGAATIGTARASSLACVVATQRTRVARPRPTALGSAA